MTVGWSGIGLFNYKTAVTGRVMPLRPTVIANKMLLISKSISVEAIRIPLLVSILYGSGRALASVRFSLHY